LGLWRLFAFHLSVSAAQICFAFPVSNQMQDSAASAILQAESEGVVSTIDGNSTGSQLSDIEQRYLEAQRKRKECVDAVLVPTDKHKVVVAGPGTGKTYLFRRMLEGKRNSLTLTFVNSLVEDLSLELCGLSEVRTLHGFARSLLPKARIYPKLAAVIEQDSEILLGRIVDFDALFNELVDAKEDIQFYKRRKDYYGHYGFSDMVYAAVRLFESKPDKIPAYEQVLVDEFQDFNKLEVSMIDHLASRSPVLLAGDDDQALYESLRNASPEHIRGKHADDASYEGFSLPYCSRCPRVVVEATNDVVRNAMANGCLKGRIDKPFTYFDCSEKDAICDRYPSITHITCFSSQIPWMVTEKIKELARIEQSSFSILFICPTRTQCRLLARGLRDKGFLRVNSPGTAPSREPTLLDGLRLLLTNKNCNLGWRIVAKELLSPDEFSAVVKETDLRNLEEPVVVIVDKAVTSDIRSILTVLRAVRDGKLLKDPAKLDAAARRLGIDPIELAAESLRPAIDSKTNKQADHSIRGLPITVTTVASSKGLSADYTFLTHFDDRYLMKEDGQPSDQEVCGFLVALTRARKKAFVVTSDARKR